MPKFMVFEDHLGVPPGEENLGFYSLNSEFCSVKIPDYLGRVASLNRCKMT